MKISHIEHLGIAVQSIEESLPFFKDVLGLECYATEVVEDQKVKTAFFCVEDGVAKALAEVSEKGVRLIDEKPRKGAEGLNIAFLHPKSTCGILTELCEHPE